MILSPKLFSVPINKLKNKSNCSQTSERTGFEKDSKTVDFAEPKKIFRCERNHQESSKDHMRFTLHAKKSLDRLSKGNIIYCVRKSKEDL